MERATTPPITDETLHLYLNNAGIENVYAERAVLYYREALSAHTRGEDLKQYLFALQSTASRAGWASYRKELNTDEIKFIEDGVASEGQTTYDLRLGFTQRDDFELSLAYSLRQQKQPTLQDEYEKFLRKISKKGKEVAHYEGSINWLDRWDYERKGRDVAGLSLDQKFNEKGQKKGLLDDINAEMVRFSLAVDEPDIAGYFIDRLTDKSKKVDLYFESLKSDSAAAIRVLQKLSGLREELDSDPLNLCRFMIREISDLGTKMAIDVKKNAQDVIVLTNDPQLFKPDAAELVELIRTITPGEEEESFWKWVAVKDYLRLELARALILDGEQAVAEEVLSRTREDHEHIRPEELDQSIQKWRVLVAAEKDQLNRRQKRRLRKLAKSTLEFFSGGHVYGDFDPPVMVLKPNRENVTAWLALAIIKDGEKYRYYDGKKYRQITAEDFVLDNAQYYYRNNLVTSHISDIYEKHFPAGTATLDLGKSRRLKALAEVGRHDEADSLFWEQAADERESSVNKLVGAIAMAACFNERPDSNIEKEAEVAGNIELLLADVAEATDIKYIDIVSLSSARQALQKRIDQIHRKIERLDESRRKLYLSQLAQIHLPQ